MVEAAGGATWAPVAAAVDSGSISAVTVTVAPTAKKPTAARAAPTLKAAHSRKLAVQESGSLKAPTLFYALIHPSAWKGHPPKFAGWICRKRPDMKQRGAARAARPSR